MPSFFASLALFCILQTNQSAQKHSYIPPNGFVPNAITASKIAEAVLVPIYGEKEISKQKPFEIRLEGEIWIVRGKRPKDFIGGSAVIEISKKNGCILRVSHSK